MLKLLHISEPKFIISIAFMWLFTGIALLGFLAGYEEGFIVMLPMNVLLYFVFIIWNSTWKQLAFLVLIPFCISLAVLMLAMKYPWILGKYEYGETMGFKINKVPVTIGISWIILTYCTTTIAQWITPIRIQSVGIASVLFFIFHFLFSLSAPKLDLWTFQNDRVPLRHHGVIFGVIVFTQYIFQNKIQLQNKQIALHMYLTILIFAISFVCITV